VLLLSDDSAIQLSVASTLRTYGYEVLHATTHAETLLQVRQRPIGILVADLDRQPADRLSVVRAARQADPALPVIYTIHGLTGLSAGDRVSGAPCLRTPYHPHQLLNLVRQLVRRASERDESHAA
jgi:DNA-binding response OmpR family regulator